MSQKSRETSFGFFAGRVLFLIVIFLQDLCQIFMERTLFSENLSDVDDLVMSIQLLLTVLFSIVYI